MNVIAPTFPDRDAFLRWNEGREGRREYVRGQIVTMTGATRNHQRLVMALSAMLFRLLDPARFEVLPGDLGIKTRAGVRFPDVLVDRAGGGGKDLAARQPILVAEVLSPSSLGADLVEKEEEYSALPSLTAYLVLSQDEAAVRLWTRSESGWSGPLLIVGMENAIELSHLGVALPLRELYAGVAAV